MVTKPASRGPDPQVVYRLELAAGFLKEAEADFDLCRWRSTTSHAILVLENVGLAVLMLFGVSPRTHKPGMHLSRLLGEGTLSDGVADRIGQLLPAFDRHDSHQKMLLKYGDEVRGLLPWTLFGEPEAAEALETARTALLLGREIAGLAAR